MLLQNETTSQGAAYEPTRVYMGVIYPIHALVLNYSRLSVLPLPTAILFLANN